MKYMLLVYTDPTLLDELSPVEFDSSMKRCLDHADDLVLVPDLAEDAGVR